MSDQVEEAGNNAQNPIYFDTLEGVQQLLKALPNINYEIGKYGATVLELACAYTTDIEVIKFLLNHGANIHHSDKYGRNAFAHAWFNKAPYIHQRNATFRTNKNDVLLFLKWHEKH